VAFSAIDAARIPAGDCDSPTQLAGAPIVYPEAAAPDGGAETLRNDVASDASEASAEQHEPKHPTSDTREVSSREVNGGCSAARGSTRPNATSWLLPSLLLSIYAARRRRALL